MRCAKCGADVKPTDTCCPNCSQACTDIQTIEDVHSEDDQYEQIEKGSGYYEYKHTGPGRRIHVRQINLSRMGFWTTLLGIFMVIVLFILALPLAILLALVFTIFWFLVKRRY